MNIITLKDGAVVNVATDTTALVSEASPRIGSLHVGGDNFRAPTDAVQVDAGTVVSVIAGQWAADQAGTGWTDVAAGTVSAGMVTADGATFADPPPPVLTAEEKRAAMAALTPRQLRLGLLRAGITLASIEAMIDAIADAPTREASRVEWEYGLSYHRMHPMVVAFGSGLGLTADQIDALWTQSSAI